MLAENILKELSQKFSSELQGPVTLVLFTSELASESCGDTRLMLHDLSELSDKIALRVHNFVLDKEEVARYGVDKIPAIVPLGTDDKDYGIRFYGLPGGYEFSSLIAAIIEVSQAKTQFSEEAQRKIENIDVPLHIQVFVTPT
jgi:alkyl hydroperoxide reductase subunit AhpF